MINTSTYRGFEIIINVGTGGWLVQGYAPAASPSETPTVKTLASAPTQESARAWIDRYIAAGNLSNLEPPINE